MKKIFLLMIVFLSLNAATDTFEYKDETLRLRISKDSINRIILPEMITEKLYSKEKNLNIIVNGNEAYIKVVPEKKTKIEDDKVIKSEIVYSSGEVEVFFITKNKTYALIFVPVKIDPRTVLITDNSLIKEDIAKVEKASTEYVKNIKNIFRLAIVNKLSNSFEETHENKRHENMIFLSSFKGLNFSVYKFFLEKIDSETIKRADNIAKEHIVASALFENNYFIITEN